MISFATLSRTLLRLGLRRQPNVDQKQRRCIRLAVETLEDRIVPSTESLLSNLAVSGGVVSGVNTTLTIGQTLSLSVDVTAYPSAASPTPTGSVTFTLSVGMTEYTIGTVTLTSIGGYVAQAVLTTSILPTTPDTYELSYTYYGDANYSGANASDAAEVTMEAPASGTPPNLAPSGGLGALPVPSGDVIASAPDTAITGVVYGTGAISTSRTDLSSNGFGTPWGQDWVYSTQSGYTDGISGGLANQAQPHLVSINSGTTIAVVAGTNAYFFDYYNDQFNARFGLDATLIHNADAGQYVLNVDGMSYAFNDFSDYDATAAAGSLLSVTDAYGDVTQATAWNGSGNVTTVEQTYGSGDTEQAQEFVTTYYSSGAAEGLVDTVTQETQTGTDGWNTVETATYAYYGSSSSNGLAGELMTAVVTDASDNILSAAYYRYYKGSGIGGGSPAEAGFLK